ncbi:MAG: response regulator [Bacteroidales bacterium]|nr:response regulator [Bacteroidales bacterium]
MNEIKVLIVEDELVVAMMIHHHLEETGYKVFDPVNNYEKAIVNLAKLKPDIVILDIKLEGEKSGIDLAHYLKNTINIPYIFVTSHIDTHTLEQVKKLNPSAFLVKPFTKNDLYTSIELALHKFKETSVKRSNQELADNKKNNDSIFIKKNNQLQKISYSEIMIIKSEHVYIELCTKEGDRHLIRSSMNSICENLPQNFLRVHRSYTVNINYIDSINSGFLIIQGRQIPIGGNYKELLLNSITIK